MLVGLLVGVSVGDSVGLNTFVKKLPLLEYKSDVWHITLLVVKVVTVLTVVPVVAEVTFFLPNALEDWI